MKIVKLKIENSVGGYAVVELLFYIALFALMTLATINGIITMTKSFRETSIQSEFLQSGNIVEKISREVRQAYDISAIAGADITLNTTEGESNKTVRFLLSGSNLQFFENGILTGNLNTPNISVTGVTFTQITAMKGKAVKISIAVQSLNDKLSRTKTFYNTVVLRGYY